MRKTKVRAPSGEIFVGEVVGKNIDFLAGKLDAVVLQLEDGRRVEVSARGVQCLNS